jgi:hypothetical protein
VQDGLTDLKATHGEAAEIVEDRATAIAPRRTGRLAADIRSSGQAAGGVVRAGRARVRYAGVIHFGWAAHNIEPQPFLYDALDDRRDEVVAAYNDGVKRLLKKNDLT